MTERGSHRRLLGRVGGGLVITAVGGAVFWVLWRPCLPFLMAFLFSAVLHRPHRWLLCRLLSGRGRTAKKEANRQTDIPRVWNVSAAVLLVLVCAGIGGGLLFGIGYLLWDAVGRVFSWLADNAAVIIGAIGAISGGIAAFLSALPITGAFTGDAGGTTALAGTLSGMISDLLGGVLGSVSAKASSAVTSFAAALPKSLLFIGVFLLASVYMTAEYEALSKRLLKCIPSSVRQKWDKISHGVGHAARGVLLSYEKMACLTFGMLFAGLLLLGVNGALGIALAGAALDALPFIGVGAVLLPWALFSFVCGRIGRGVGLTVLYLVITVTRQVIEPRIIGRSIGLHPLAALFALYAGGVLFGAVGMLAVPFCLSVLWFGYRAVKHDT